MIIDATNVFIPTSPESWNHLLPPGGGEGGEQPRILAEHQRISEAGVGKGSASSAHTEQVIAQHYCATRWNCEALVESLV